MRELKSYSNILFSSAKSRVLIERERERERKREREKKREREYVTVNIYMPYDNNDTNVQWYVTSISGF